MSLTENNHPDNSLKVLEQLGKESLTEYLEKLVQNNVLKLKEEENQTLNNAEYKDKHWVFVDAMKTKHSRARKMLLHNLLNVDKSSHHRKVRVEHPKNSSGCLQSVQVSHHKSS